MAERYIGIDLNEKYAMISFYTQGMSEPTTFSMVTGNEVYQIPLCVSRKKGVSQWFYGEEARKLSREEGTVCVEGLLKKALAKEPVEIEGEIYDTAELLFVFLRKLMALPFPQGGNLMPDKLVLTAECMNQEMRELFGMFADKIKLPLDRLMLMDYRESFYYYALSQPAELCVHDVALYYYTSKKLLFWRLSHDKRTLPQVVTIEEKSYDGMLNDRDREFAKLADVSLYGNLTSAVYLIGDGFDGDWMKKTLATLCRGRRVFMGKNLFCKGACYGAAAKADAKRWKYVYMGDNEIQMNVSLKVENAGKSELVSLITAGDNWYEAGAEYEVILNGSPTIDFWFQHPKSKKAVVKTLEITDMPERENRTSRLRISAKPVSVKQVKLSIRDLGFGEIAKSTEKAWEYTMSFE